MAFLIAATNSSLLIVDRPEISSRRATSTRCFFDELALTPSALEPLAFGPPPRPLIGRPLLRLLLPVVADLLEAVLQRAVSHPVRAFALAVLLAAASCALAKVRCAFSGDFFSVLGSSLFLAWPPLSSSAS